MRVVIRDPPAPHKVQVDPTTTREGKEKEPRFRAPADLGLGYHLPPTDLGVASPAGASVGPSESSNSQP